MEKHIVVLSDMHVGSIYGLLPMGFKTSEGVEKILNAGQRYLLDCWYHALSVARRLKPVAVVINGDVVDGLQRAQRGSELSLPLIFDQKGAAIELLKPWRKLANLYFVKGTEYHDSIAGAAIEAVAEDLHAVRYDSMGPGKFSRDVLNLEVDGVVINFSHGIGTSGSFYKSSALDRELQMSILAEMAGAAVHADVVVRSHAHYFRHVEHTARHGVITPAWELQTGFMRKNSSFNMLPDIGFTVLTIDSEREMDKCLVTKKLYPLPLVPPQVVVL